MNSFCWSLKDVILFPQRPASLKHKNPQRRKIIHEMCPVGCKERSIDLKMILNNILLVGFLWLLFLKRCIFILVFFVLLNI